MYVTSAKSITENVDFPALMAFDDATGKYSQIRSLQSGQSLFCEGDDAGLVYQVIEGVVRTCKVLRNGRRQILSFGYPGDIVGLSHDGFYHSDCDAVCDVKVQILRKNARGAIFDNDPDLADRLLRYAAAEVINMQEHFLMLGRKSASEKIASFLVALLDRVGVMQDSKTCFDLPMNRSDIADFLGLTIETVSRTLTKLRKAGIIDLPAPHRVCVCKVEALRNLVESEN